MKVIDDSLLNKTSEQAKQSPRLRKNYDFHDSLDDTVNRLLNAMEPGTYIRPHRHRKPAKDEIFLLLRGKAALFMFDDSGAITEQVIISPQDGVYGADFDGSFWHSLLVLESNTIVYEIKEGPYQPIPEEDFAPWSPDAKAGDLVAEYMENLHQMVTRIK